MKNKFLILAFSLFLMATSSYAMSPGSEGGESNSLVMRCDSSGADICDIDKVMVQRLGKQVTNIIFQADSVVANVTPWNGETLAPVTMKPWMVELMRHTLCEPRLYQSDKKTYTQFGPWTWIVFYRGGESVTIQFDYSISKWQVVKAGDVVVCRKDLPSKAFLSLFHMMFPKSSLLSKRFNESIDDYEK